MGQRSKEERDRLARKVTAVLREGTKSVAVIAEEFKISVRTVRRYKKADLTLQERMENPLDVLRMFRYTEKELEECKTEVRAVISQQKVLKKRWDRYYSDRKNRATAHSSPSVPKPQEEYKPHLILEATKLLSQFEKARINLGQEIGAVPKAGVIPLFSTPPPAGVGSESSGGNGSGPDDLLSRVNALPRGQQQRVTAVVRQAYREIRILKKG